MTDILAHLQPDSPLYEATRDAAREEIVRLRSLNKELAEALADLTSSLDVIWHSGLASRKDLKAELDFARAALTKYRGKE